MHVPDHHVILVKGRKRFLTKHKVGGAIIASILGAVLPSVAGLIADSISHRINKKHGSGYKAMLMHPDGKSFLNLFKLGKLGEILKHGKAGSGAGVPTLLPWYPYMDDTHSHNKMAPKGSGVDKEFAHYGTGVDKEFAHYGTNIATHYGTNVATQLPYYPHMDAPSHHHKMNIHGKGVNVPTLLPWYPHMDGSSYSSEHGGRVHKGRGFGKFGDNRNAGYLDYNPIELRNEALGTGIRKRKKKGRSVANLRLASNRLYGRGMMYM